MAVAQPFMAEGTLGGRRLWCCLDGAGRVGTPGWCARLHNLRKLHDHAPIGLSVRDMYAGLLPVMGLVAGLLVGFGLALAWSLFLNHTSSSPLVGDSS